MAARTSWPIGGILAAALGLVILLFVGGLALISVNTLRDATEEQITKRAAQDIDATIESLRAFLRPARDQVRTIARRISEKRIAMDDRSRLGDLISGALISAPHVDALLVVEPDYQAMIGAQVRQNGTSLLLFRNEGTRPGMREAMAIAREIEDPFWGAPVFVAGLGTMINVMMPIRIDGEFRGLVAATVGTAGIARLLDSLDSGISTRHFVLLDQDRMLAHPAMAEPFSFAPSEQKPLPDAPEIGDLVVTSFVAGHFVAESYYDQALSLDITVLELPGHQRPYFVAHREIADFGPPSWIVGAYVNADSFSGERRFLFMLAGAGAGMLVIGLLVSLWLGFRISRPVKRLARAAEQIAASDPDDLEMLPSSRVREIDQAGAAFNRMIVSLRDRAFLRATFGKYVPESVARLILDNRSVVQEPQLRNATIMFTDIAGFTSLCESLCPAETIDLLNEYFSAVVEPVEANGGVIQQYQGDAMLATFNIPTDRPGHADDAVGAALAIQRILHRRTFGPGLTIRTRIGINTGDIVGGTVGAGGRLGYTVHGDPVNIAARLEALNKEYGSTIIISEETRQQLTIPVVLTQIGSVDIRGRSRPVTISALSEGDQPDQQVGSGGGLRDSGPAS
ncbi:MAG: adenylate/guanylate cyclase domain-containing protein [Rhodospirillales bacterium]